MRNVQWMSAGLFAGLLSLAGPSFADGGPSRAALTSAAEAARASGPRPPIQSGAAAGKNGIQVSVLSHSCSQTAEPDFPGVDVVEAIVEVEVRNGTPAPIVVHRDHFQLGAPGGGAIRPSMWFAGTPRSIDPGQARTFELRFMNRGDLSCFKKMVLQSSSAVEKGTDRVAIDAITLAPAETLSGYGASSS